LLRESLTDDPEIASFAVRTLGKIGKAASSTVEDLAKLLARTEHGDDGFQDASIRVLAAEAIGDIGFQSEQMLRTLKDALNDEIPFLAP
jgi:hypothetical protein